MALNLDGKKALVAEVSEVAATAQSVVAAEYRGLTVGKISRQQLEEIAKTKTPDLTAADLDAAVRTIAGSARSMGVDVEGV